MFIYFKVYDLQNWNNIDLTTLPFLIKKNQLDEICNTHKGGEVYNGFWWVNLRRKRILGNRRRRWEGNINPYLANVENMVSSNNASSWQMGFNSVSKWLKKYNH